MNEPPPAAELARWHPVRLRIDDDLRRSRLTVLLRILLALPHYAWLLLWEYAMFPLVVFMWLAALFSGRVEDDLHRFVGRWARYHVHLYAYLYLLANPYPRFFGRPGMYPIDLELAAPERQKRWTILFRLVLAIPAFIFAGVLGTIGFVVAFLGWFAALGLGRMPRGMRDLGAYCLRFQAQAYAYLLLLTQRYPSLGGGTSGIEPPVAYER
jgi:Domain of unknown function (DUF4389)